MKLLDVFSKISDEKNIKKYILIVFICGIALMLIPTSDYKEAKNQDTNEEVFSLEKEEKRLENTLSTIDGVGKCNVLLSISEGTQLILAEDQDGTVVIDSGNAESPITVLKKYPCYQGAVIVCGGAENSNIRFDILSAVMSYTGLGVDKITICPIQK